MTREYTVWRGSTRYTNTLLRARHEGRGLFADGGLDLPEIARQLGNLLYEDRLRYYKTVNTRRHRLKQPKFVLRCTQLQVGLPHAIGRIAFEESVL